MKNSKKLFLCQENLEFFYINAKDLTTAKQMVVMYNATVIKELPRRFEKVDPSTLPMLLSHTFPFQKSHSI